jgi:predicted TIM-barrel fold metal-dependent hydrolase
LRVRRRCERERESEYDSWKGSHGRRISRQRTPVEPSQGIDTHAHVFSASAPAVHGARYRPDYEAPLASWRALARASGITHGVLVQPSFFGADNSEMLDTLASDPRRLRGVAVLHPLVDAGTLRKFHAGGVRAMRLNLRGAKNLDYYANDAWRGLFDRVHALGWHIEVFVDSGRLPEVARVLARSPVAIAFDHFGMPGRDERAISATFAAVEELSRTRPVWCKLSGPYRLEGADPQALAARWIDTVGVDRIVWGSDWPWTGHEKSHDYPQLRAALEEWVGPGLVQAVLWDNAARLYRFD